MQAANKLDKIALHDQADPIITDPDSITVLAAAELAEMWDRTDGGSRLDILDHTGNPVEK